MDCTPQCASCGLFISHETHIYSILNHRRNVRRIQTGIDAPISRAKLMSYTTPINAPIDAILGDEIPSDDLIKRLFPTGRTCCMCVPLSKVDFSQFSGRNTGEKYPVMQITDMEPETITLPTSDLKSLPRNNGTKSRGTGRKKLQSRIMSKSKHNGSKTGSKKSK